MSSIYCCPECSRTVTAADARRTDFICTICGAAIPREAAGRWTNVARVASLAEAGFLVDELSGEGINARIYQADDFNALTDRWSATYLIQSSPADAQAVATRIRQYLAEVEAKRSETVRQSKR